MAIVDAGEGTFIDTEGVDPPEGGQPGSVYAYAHFSSLERVSYGLRRTAGGPKDREIDSVKVGSYEMESLAKFWEFGHALEAIERSRSRTLFESEPFVEVESHNDYKEALKALNLDPDDSQWEYPGLYDFRDDPPTYAGAVEEYELEEMEIAADEAIDFMFQGDEWEKAYYQLGGEE